MKAPLARVATPLFGLAIFTAAALLFAIQPMIAKRLLPEFGGSSRVWLVSLFFFQAALLLGYSYAHFSHSWLGKRQILLHLVVAAAVFWWLPIQASAPLTAVDSPNIQLLTALGLSVGFPFFVLAATSPLLQAWWAQLKGDGQEPYFLYSASNAGSLLALLAYPFLLELWFPISQQLQWWSWGYAAFAAMLIGTAAMTLRFRQPQPVQVAANQPVAQAGPSAMTKVSWVVLAALPSSLLQSVTLYFSTDLAAAPLLWVVPLAIYLITFIIAFGRFDKKPNDLQVRMTGFAVILSAALLISKTYDPAALLFGVYAITLFLAALLAHQKLANARPQPKFLTEYYLWISLGGALGAGLNAFLAPLVFNDVWEFPIGLALVGLVVAGKPKLSRNFYLLALGPAAVALVSYLLFGDQETPTPVSRLMSTGIPLVLIYLSLAVRGSFGLALGLWMLASGWMYTDPKDQVLVQERGFFGVHRVVFNEQIDSHDLQHGTTLHGRELKGERNPIPSTYYHPTSPLSELLRAMPKPEWGVVGLGAGTLSAYALPNEKLTFFELDPIVADLAQDERYFRFLTQAKERSNIELKLGDARLTVTELEQDQLTALLIDAFSSDSIPLHLVTLDALDLYASKVKANGLLIFHISNQYIDLRSILARIAEERGWHPRLALDVVLSETEEAEGKIASAWLAISFNQTIDSRLNPKRWLPISSSPGTPLWTDEQSSLLHTIDVGWMTRAAADLDIASLQN